MLDKYMSFINFALLHPRTLFFNVQLNRSAGFKHLLECKYGI